MPDHTDPSIFESAEEAARAFARVNGMSVEQARPIVRGLWAYHDANGKPLRGPCKDVKCRYASAPGGGEHDGPHSWQED